MIGISLKYSRGGRQQIQRTEGFPLSHNEADTYRSRDSSRHDQYDSNRTRQYIFHSIHQFNVPTESAKKMKEKKIPTPTKINKQTNKKNKQTNLHLKKLEREKTNKKKGS